METQHGSSDANSAFTVKYYKKDFWSTENRKFVRPHYRLQKCANILSRLGGNAPVSILDVGCGPATLSHFLPPNFDYYGIDIAIHDPAPNLIESDILENPIQFEDKRFDIVFAQGVFEYLGEFQEQKFAEIAQILRPDGRFVVTYTNFDHRHQSIYWPYSNVQPFDDFHRSLGKYFDVQRFYPTSYNWNHDEPNRKLVKAANMPLRINIPIVGHKLAVAYFFICSPRPPAGSTADRTRGATAG